MLPIRRIITGFIDVRNSSGLEAEGNSCSFAKSALQV